MRSQRLRSPKSSQFNRPKFWLSSDDWKNVHSSIKHDKVIVSEWAGENEKVKASTIDMTLQRQQRRLTNCGYAKSCWFSLSALHECALSYLLAHSHLFSLSMWLCVVSWLHDAFVDGVFKLLYADIYGRLHIALHFHFNQSQCWSSFVAFCRQCKFLLHPLFLPVLRFGYASSAKNSNVPTINYVIKSSSLHRNRQKCFVFKRGFLYEMHISDVEKITGGIQTLISAF